MGRVYQMRQKTSVPAGHYEDAFQLKYYARGVGNVRVGWKGADEMQKINRLRIREEKVRIVLGSTPKTESSCGRE